MGFDWSSLTRLYIGMGRGFAFLALERPARNAGRKSMVPETIALLRGGRTRRGSAQAIAPLTVLTLLTP
jgi:hypothetical protein